MSIRRNCRELVTKLISFKLSELDKNTFQVKKTSIDKAEAAQLLSQHIGKTIKQAFNLIKGEDVIETQIEIANLEHAGRSAMAWVPEGYDGKTHYGLLAAATIPALAILAVAVALVFGIR